MDATKTSGMLIFNCTHAKCITMGWNWGGCEVVEVMVVEWLVGIVGGGGWESLIGDLNMLAVGIAF